MPHERLLPLIADAQREDQAAIMALHDVLIDLDAPAAVLAELQGHLAVIEAYGVPARRYYAIVLVPSEYARSYLRKWLTRQPWTVRTMAAVYRGLSPCGVRLSDV